MTNEEASQVLAISLALRTRAKTTSDFEAQLPSPRPSPIGWERENRAPRQLAYPAVVEGARDGSGCSLSRRTGEGQGEGHFVRYTPPVRHLFLHRPLDQGRAGDGHSTPRRMADLQIFVLPAGLSEPC